MSDFRLLRTFFIVFVLLVETIWSSDLILQNQVLKRESLKKKKEKFLKKLHMERWGGMVEFCKLFTQYS